jgi:hypothetical protein
MFLGAEADARIVSLDDAAAHISQPNPFLAIFTKPLFA